MESVNTIQVRHGDTYAIDINALCGIMRNPSLLERWILKISKYNNEFRAVKFIDVSKKDEPETGEEVAYGAINEEGTTFMVSLMDIE